MVSPVRGPAADHWAAGVLASTEADVPVPRARSKRSGSVWIFIHGSPSRRMPHRGQGRYVTPGAEPYRVNASFGAYHAELVFLRGWPVQSARADPPCPARDAAQPPVRDPALLYPITIGGVPNCIPRTGLLLSRSALMTAGLQAAISPISARSAPTAEINPRARLATYRQRSARASPQVATR